MAFKTGLWRKLKHYQIYNRQQLSRALGVDITTIYNWSRLHGLQPINPGEKVVLFEGIDVINFLKIWEESRKVPLKPGEFYCVHHKKAALPKQEDNELQPSGTYNKDGTQTMIKKARCSVCGKKISNFTSGKKTVK